VVTTIYIAGITERRDRTIIRVSYDSATAIVTCAAGLGLLFFSQ
jgi:cation:H+ antiporter